MPSENFNDGVKATISMIILSFCWLSIDSNESIILKILISSLMIIITILLFHRDSDFAIPTLFLLGLCLRFHYLSFVGFSHVPYADAQIDLFMTNVLTENEQITFIHHELYDDRLLYYSSWPLSQLCVVTFSHIAGIENLLSTHIMQLLFYSSCFLLAYCISNWFNHNILDGSDKNLRWAILLFISLPELNFWQGEFVRLNLGVLSSFFVVYCLTHMTTPENRFQSSILLILSCIMLGFSHNLTTAIAVLSFILAISILAWITYREGSLFDMNTRSFINTQLNIFALLSIVAIIWWSLVGEVLFPKIQGVVERYSTILLEGFSLAHDPRIQTPAELSPSWSKLLLYSRDGLILVPTAIGFLLLTKKNLGKSSLPFNFLFSFSVSYFLIFILLFLWAEPFRVLTYASPFMAICMAHFYNSDNFWKKIKSKESIKSAILILILAGSFVSPNTHTHSPMYFYDGDMDRTDYGLPGIHARDAILFTIDHSSKNSTISSDYPDFSIHPIGPSEITRFYSIGLDLEEDDSGNITYIPSTSIVILIRDGSLFQFQSAQSTNSSFIDFTEKSESAIITELRESGNLVYDQGNGVSVWTIPS